MKTFDFIKNLTKFDNYIISQRKAEQLRQKMIAAIIVACIFVVLSVVNIIESSYLMLAITASCAVILFIFVLIGYLTKSPTVISWSITFICAIAFTIFIITCGNSGFASLWVIFVPIVSMLVIDFKVGFAVSIYFFLLLPIMFWTPLKDMIIWEGYAESFMFRFPFYYATSFAFSLFLCYVFKKNEYELHIKQKELQYEKDYDPMTGIYNRSKYMAKISGSFLKYDSIGVIFLDVNFLKYVNDNFGHDAGDDLIVTTANSLKNTAKDNTYLFRIGGDEFVVVLKNCEENACEEFIAEWKKNLDAIKNKNSGYDYSVSYGYSFARKEFNLTEIIKEADDKMYEYKRNFYNDLKNSGTYGHFYKNK